MKKVELKETKNFKELKKTFDSFSEKKDTMLAIFNINEEDGGVMFCGDAVKLSLGFYEIIKQGLKNHDDEKTPQFDIFCALMLGIKLIVDERSQESDELTSILMMIYEKANKKEKDIVDMLDSLSSMIDRFKKFN